MRRKGYRNEKNKKTAAAALCALIAAAVLCCTLFPLRAAALTPAYAPSESYKECIYYNNLCELTLTGDRRADIVAVAQSQVGYREGDSPAELSGGGSGSGNCTEYGYAFGQTEDAWCAMFIWWCGAQAGIPESIVARTEWARTQTYGCPYLPYADSAPLPGDIAFIDTDGDGEENHVGLITAVDENHVTTVEGNCSDMVQSIRYRRDDGSGYGSSSILYVGTPEYSSAGSDRRAVTYARVLTDSAKAYKFSTTLSRVMATCGKGEEHLLLRSRELLGQRWLQLEFGLNAYWLKAESCELFTVTESGGTTAPTTATTAATTTAAITANITAPAAQPDAAATATTAPATATTALHTAPDTPAAPNEYSGSSPEALLPEAAPAGVAPDSPSGDTAAAAQPSDSASPDLSAERAGTDDLRTLALALVGISSAVLLGVIIAILRRNREQ